MMKISGNFLLHAYQPACVLRVTGPDAAPFLQGQFTNDLSKVKVGHALYGLWLDRKGHVLADSSVLPAAEGGFWIASTTSASGIIGPHLCDHIIADDVLVEDQTAGWRGTALVGDGVGAWLGAAGRPGLVFPGRRATAESWEWLYPEGDEAGVSQGVAGARRADPAEMERMRIEAGIPSVPADIGPADLPNEGRLDQEAISYSKGCYLGQEVMARIKSLGRVRRTLIRVRGGGEAPTAPAPLWRGDRREGELRTVVASVGGFTGLALVSVSSASTGAPFALASGGAAGVEIAP